MTNYTVEKNMINQTHPLHSNCIICKSSNPDSLGMTYTIIDDWLASSLITTEHMQGYDGIIHGGIIAAMLDAVMVNYLLYHKIQALTAELNIRYKEVLPTNQQIQVRATLLSRKKMLYVLKSELICNQRLIAAATGKFISI